MPRPPPADLSSQSAIGRQAPQAAVSPASGENIVAPLKGQVRVLLPMPVGDGYDYAVPEEIAVSAGDFVEVPLGRRHLLGVVWGPGTATLAAEKIKPIRSKLPTAPMSDSMRKLIDWVARYTLSPPGAVLRMAMSVPDALMPPRPTLLYQLGPAPAPDLKLTAARKRVLEFMAQTPALPAADIARGAGVGVGVVKNLQPLGLIEPVWLTSDALPTQPDADHVGVALSDAQEQAASAFRAMVQAKSFAVSLLDGVPGAGKTEVYFEAVAAALKQSRQVLVLLPEIALSAQWLHRFEQRFGTMPGEWHSDLTGLERRRTWRAVQAGSVKVVVGARSALFLPFRDLGLIVVDEEHESAFKQEDGVIYNARDMAIVRARIEDVPAVLVSATPSLETIVNAEAGRYGLQHLPARHGGADMVQVETVDLRQKPPLRGQFLSPVLIEAMRETLARDKQALLFLNRRGYAPLTLCRACGHRVECPNCTAWLVEHRFRGRLICHHCGFNTPRPVECPSCSAPDSLVACGPGVERLQEEVREHFPDAHAMVLASDMIGSPRQAQALIEQIAEHEVDIVIGTQIVAKGHHFPDLALVGVVDADLGLAGGDLRAAERTFQLLYQVAGRAGRADGDGRALLQTYQPLHPVIAALASGERGRFLDAEKRARADAGMPPYGRLAALILSSEDESQVDAAARAVSAAAPHLEGVRVLGPAPAPLALLRGRHRRRLLLKTKREVDIQAVLLDWLGPVSLPNAVRLQVDVDPYSFL
jgi:primosomal protein N' (replication factor Y)